MTAERIALLRKLDVMVDKVFLLEALDEVERLQDENEKLRGLVLADRLAVGHTPNTFD